MTVTQITRYFENRDASSVHYKRFNVSPDDKYPTFSICFKGGLYWYHDMLIYNSFGVTSTKYEQLLKGEQVQKYYYDYIQMLYQKDAIDIRNGSNEGFEQFYLRFSEILTGSEFAAVDDKDSVYYGKGERGEKLEKLPFFVGYKTPDTVCFTRKSEDHLDVVRMYDWLSFNRSIFYDKSYKDVTFQIYIHYPGQLLRYFRTPIYKSTVGFETDTSESKYWNKLLRITISRVTVLRKRPNSNIPCDQALQNDDEKLKIEIMKRVGCVPIYWNKTFGDNINLEPCRFPDQFRRMYTYIQNNRNILLSYDPPCVDMTISSKYDREKNNKWDEPCLKFIYTEEVYQEIQNSRNFGFESFLSGVGGFVGIFLGYSMLQLPQLILSLADGIRRYRKKRPQQKALMVRKSKFNGAKINRATRKITIVLPINELKNRKVV